MNSPDIFHYTSLEAYLGRYFQYKKGLNPSFSYAVWAKRLGVKSPATLNMITKGRRSPGKKLVVKIQKELSLNAEQARYFEVLVNLKKHKSQVLPSLELMKELEERHPEKGFRLIDHDEFQLISNWYCWVILEMASLGGFKEDINWIQEKLEHEVSSSQIREALTIMERAHLLGRDRNGKLSRTAKPLKTTSDKSNSAIKKFHEDSLQISRSSLFKHSVEQRNFETLIVSMSESQVPEAKKMIRTFIDEFCRKFDSPSARNVYQVGVQLVPMTKDLK